MATPLPKNQAVFTLPEVVAATGGDLTHGSGTAVFCGVSTDSRTVTEGELFVPLVGERFDGHDHIAAAVERGATGVLVSRAMEAAGARTVCVPDTLRALGDLAKLHRARWSGRGLSPQRRCLVGITGSAGKTTTRNAVTAALASTGLSVHASAGNLNNAIGVPMSLFQLTEEHRAAVIEMGMNQSGEIARAAEIAAPNVAIVTLVSEAHTEGVGSLWGVLREKAMIFDRLPRDGVAIANADDPYAAATLARAGLARRVLYGESSDASVRCVSRTSKGLGGSEIVVDLDRSPGEPPLRVEATVPLIGKAGVYAALAAISVLAAEDELSILQLENYQRAIQSLSDNDPGRLHATERADGTVVIDDAYNANPASMRASIETAREIAVSLERRLVLVLGAMYELGAGSDALHEEVGRAAAAARPAVLIVVGGGVAEPLARAAEQAHLAGVVRAADRSAAESLAAQLIERRDVVLVKASNGLGLSKLAATISSG